MTILYDGGVGSIGFHIVGYPRYCGMEGWGGWEGGGGGGGFTAMRFFTNQKTSWCKVPN